MLVYTEKFNDLQPMLVAYKRVEAEGPTNYALRAKDSPLELATRFESSSR